MEWDRILRRMRSTHCTNFSQFARDALARGRVEVVYRPERDQELIAQIARIGNNINQIARWANTQRGITIELSMEALSLLEEVRRLVADRPVSAHGDHQSLTGEKDSRVLD
nr:MobC family plasmid mobilization relaxosome protein [Actinobaculum suis]